MKDANKSSITNERYHSIPQYTITTSFLLVVPLKNSEGIHTYPETFCKDIVYSLLAIYIMYSSSFNVDNW